MSADNNEPLLSAEETSALLDAMRLGGEGASQVETADLASPERPLRSALDRADACSRAMSHAIDKLMIRLTGTSTATEEQPAEIIPYKVIRGSVAQGSGVATLTTQDGSLGLLILGPALVSFMLDRRMGAPLKREGKGETRIELSPLDRRLLEPFISELTRILGQHWGRDAEAFRPGEVYADAADVPMMSQFEPMLQLSLRVSSMGAPSDYVLFALSVAAVRSSMPTKKKSEGPAASAVDKKRMAKCIFATRVRCVAVLGSTMSTVGHVLSLAKGDILRLDGSPDQPIGLRAGDTVVLTGTPVVRRGNLGIQVVGVVGNV